MGFFDEDSMDWIRVFVPARFLYQTPKFYPGTRNRTSDQSQLPKQYLMFALEYGEITKFECIYRALMAILIVLVVVSFRSFCLGTLFFS